MYVALEKERERKREKGGICKSDVYNFLLIKVLKLCKQQQQKNDGEHRPLKKNVDEGW